MPRLSLASGRTKLRAKKKLRLRTDREEGVMPITLWGYLGAPAIDIWNRRGLQAHRFPPNQGDQP